MQKMKRIFRPSVLKLRVINNNNHNIINVIIIIVVRTYGMHTEINYRLHYLWPTHFPDCPGILGSLEGVITVGTLRP